MTLYFITLYFMTLYFMLPWRTLVVSTFFLVASAMNDTPMSSCRYSFLLFQIRRTAIDCEHTRFVQLEDSPCNFSAFMTLSCTNSRDCINSGCNTHLSLPANLTLRVTERNSINDGDDNDDDDQRHSVTLHLSAQENSFIYCYEKKIHCPNEKSEKPEKPKPLVRSWTIIPF